VTIPEAGHMIAGKYRVDRTIGEGAMGVVLAATHVHLGQRVAIKLLLDHNRSADAAARFLREARASVRLHSEHVARVLDVGELPGGEPYMVMEYLDGSDLKQVIKERAPLPVSEAITYMLEACEAIAEAHSLGIIHRDLKPANLFIARTADSGRTLKVLDFGISKSLQPELHGDGLQLTRSSTVLGSPRYMAPEQLNDARNASAQSDIWSLGVILYELLTGQFPFQAAGFSDLVIVVNTTPPESPATFRADLPAGLEDAVLRCLQKDLSVRFATVAELAIAIAAFGPMDSPSSAEKSARTLEAAGVHVQRSGERPSLSSVSSRPPAMNAPSRPVGTISASMPALSRSSAALATPAPRRLSPGLIAGLVLASAALVGGIFLALRHGDDAASTTNGSTGVPAVSALLSAPTLTPASTPSTSSTPTPAPTPSAAPATPPASTSAESNAAPPVPASPRPPPSPRSGSSARLPTAPTPAESATPAPPAQSAVPQPGLRTLPQKK
jgi:eukaryotic-like serine/threonine-protein kinase